MSNNVHDDILDSHGEKRILPSIDLICIYEGHVYEGYQNKTVLIDNNCMAMFLVNENLYLYAYFEMDNAELNG